MLCDYGCGQEAIHQFKNGKWCCSRNHSGCLKMKLNASIRFTGINNPNYGKKHTEKSKKMISLTHKGNTYNLGRKFSKKHRKKISESKMGSIPWNKGLKMPERCGDKNPAWNPNLTDEERINGRRYPEYLEWVKNVFERDNYICRVCGQVGGNLIAHHLEGYNSNKELRITLSNGITLCVKCHNNFHHIYSKGNNTEEQWEEFKNGL